MHYFKTLATFLILVRPRMTYRHTPQYTHPLETPAQSESCHCGRNMGALRYHKAPKTTPLVYLLGVNGWWSGSGTLINHKWVLMWILSAYLKNNKSHLYGKHSNEKCSSLKKNGLSVTTRGFLTPDLWRWVIDLEDPVSSSFLSPTVSSHELPVLKALHWVVKESAGCTTVNHQRRLLFPF